MATIGITGTIFLALCQAAPKGGLVDISKLPPALSRPIQFEEEVYPLLKETCFKCHGPDKQKGKYRCDIKSGAFKDTDYGPTIVPGHSEKSCLIHMVAGLVDEMLMPPPSDKPGESPPLSTEQIGILRAWIDQGAKWPDGPIQEKTKAITFNGSIQALLKTSCAECHSGPQPSGAFSVDSVEQVLAGGKGYGRVVLPGDPAKSALVTIISGRDEDLPKPERHRLSPSGVAAVQEWIRQGAR